MWAERSVCLMNPRRSVRDQRKWIGFHSFEADERVVHIETIIEINREKQYINKYNNILKWAWIFSIQACYYYSKTLFGLIYVRWLRHLPWPFLRSASQIFHISFRNQLQVIINRCGNDNKRIFICWKRDAKHLLIS